MVYILLSLTWSLFIKIYNPGHSVARISICTFAVIITGIVYFANCCSPSDEDDQQNQAENDAIPGPLNEIERINEPANEAEESV